MLIFSIVRKTLSLIAVAFGMSRRKRDVSNIRKTGECNLCGENIGDPSVKGCSEENLYFPNQGPMKPLHNTEDTPCIECGCHPGYTHHASCSREPCPVCGYAIVSCPCGEQEAAKVFSLESIDEGTVDAPCLEEVSVDYKDKIRETARKAFVEDLGIKLGKTYRTIATDKHPDGRVFKAMDVFLRGRKVQIRIVDFNKEEADFSSVFLIPAEVIKSWDFAEDSNGS